jgi:hypothetical protein
LRQLVIALLLLSGCEDKECKATIDRLASDIVSAVKRELGPTAGQTPDFSDPTILQDYSDRTSRARSLMAIWSAALERGSDWKAVAREELDTIKSALSPESAASLDQAWAAVDRVCE